MLFARVVFTVGIALTGLGFSYQIVPTIRAQETSDSLPELRDMPAPGPEVTTNQETEKDRHKTNACYVSKNPARGCYYSSMHNAGEKCGCKKDGKPYDGYFE